jgi:2-polyprenyl-6-methoxyphenol hydroxylase-like FAD-dependent oxidoreductase
VQFQSIACDDRVEQYRIEACKGPRLLLVPCYPWSNLESAVYSIKMSSIGSSINDNENGKPRQIRVAIIGAGLSGLAVANGLLKDPSGRFDVQVYERDTIAFDSERGGYQVRVSSNGLSALKTIADEELWKSLREVWEGDDAKAPALVDPSTFNVHLRLGDLKLYPKSRPVSRLLLRHALLQPLLATQRVHLSHKFKSFTFRQDGCGVQLHFTDQESQSADILIAADGSGSQVNRQVGLNNKTKLKDWILIQSRGIIDKATRDKLPRSLLESGAVMTMGGKGMSGYASVYASTPNPVNKDKEEYNLFWSAVVPTTRGEQLLEKAEHNPKRVVPLFADYLRDELGYGEILPFIVSSATDLPRTGVVSSSVKPEVDWRQGIAQNARIILLGDALHPMTPGRGMGANQALTDAGNLVKLLTAATFEKQVPSDKELAHLVRQFDAEMYPRAFKMVKASEDFLDLDLTKTSGRLLLKGVWLVMTVLGWGVSVLEAIGLMNPAVL